MQTAIILTQSELTDLLSPIVHKAVSEALKSAKYSGNAKGATEEADYLTLREACKYLKISRPTFIALRKSGAFLAHPVGNRHLFRKSDLEAFVQSKKV